MFNAGIRGYCGARGLLGALKARAPRASLVEELLNMSDAENCASYLRGLPFLQGIDAGTSRRDLEGGLRTACMVFGARLAGFLGGAARGFVEAYLLRYSVHNVKALFRAVQCKPSQERSEALYPGAEVYASPRERAALDTAEKVIDFTKGTVLEKAVGLAYDTYRAGDSDGFLFELALDSQYAARLWEAARKVHLCEGQKLAERVVIPYLGSNALVWSMWLRTHHGMKPEEIMNRLHIPGEIIRPQNFVQLVKSEDAAAAAGLVKAHVLREFLSAKYPLGDVRSWHRLSRKFVWERLSGRDAGIVFDITSVVMTLMRWEFIVDDAITVTTGKAMRMERDQIVPLLTTIAA